MSEMNRLFSIYPLKPRIQHTFRYFCTYSKDFYQILGCNRTSTPHDLKAAYLQLSLQWHPDRHEDAEKENAEEKFKEVSLHRKFCRDQITLKKKHSKRTLECKILL